jgi:prevent-host-death family protein
MTKSNILHINIHEAKTHLSRYLHQVEKGEEILLCRKDHPVARVIPFGPVKHKTPLKRMLGIGKRMGKLTDAFFEPLTDEEFPGIGL